MTMFDDEGVADRFPRAGSGFVLRRLSGDDLPEFQAYRHDPELGRYQGWLPMPDDDARAFLAEMHRAPFPNNGQWIQVGIADPGTGRLIGDIGVFFDQDHRFAEIGFTLARHAHGRGIATAAVCEVIDLIFGATPVGRVIGITDARNTASIRLLERAGMRRTETRENLFRGEPCVEYLYTRTRRSADGPA